MWQRTMVFMALFWTLPCLGGTSEFHLSSVSQEASAEKPFPGKTYSIISISYVFEPTQQPGAPTFQWCFSAAGGASNRVESNSPGSTSYFKPGGYGSVGLRLFSTGQLRFGAGADLRVGSDHTGGSSGDTGNIKQSSQIRPWVLGIAQYRFMSANLSPVLSLSAGFTPSQTAGSPTRELGLSAGVRF